jgi:hypothetical protein
MLNVTGISFAAYPGPWSVYPDTRSIAERKSTGMINGARIAAKIVLRRRETLDICIGG